MKIDNLSTKKVVFENHKTIINRFIKNSWHWFINALFPPRCLMCKTEGQYLCDNHKNFDPAPKNEAHFDYLDDIIASTAYYSPTAEKTVEFFKFRGFQEMAKIMAQEMVAHAPKNFFDNSALVPIPLHRIRKFWRGFNQSEILAKEVFKLCSNVKISKALIRTKRTHQQAKLKKVERQKNLESAFKLDNVISVPQKVILIDDVVASGATLDSAAQVLKSHGVDEVCALVFARGGKK